MKTIYYCIGESCNDEVCRKGNRCVSCAQKKWHQEHPNARSGKNSSAYIDGRSLKTYYCTEKDCNKIVCLKGNRCKSHANKLKNLGRKRPDNIIRNKKIFKNCIPWNKNKKLSKLHIKHLKEAHKGIKFSKERKINMSKARVKSWLEPTYRKKLTRERKLRWKNKEYKDNWIKK